MVSLILWSPKLNRLMTNLALINILVNVLLFLYLYLWLEGIRGVQQPLVTVSWAMPVGGITLAVAVFSLMAGIFPVFGFLSPFIVITLLYGCIMSFHFVPSFGILSRKQPQPAPRRKRMTRHEDSD